MKKQWTQCKKAVIIASQPVTEGMLNYVPNDAAVIAADAGWLRAEEIGLIPDLVVGDFDSSPKPSHLPNTIHLPTEKDDSDLHFAVKEALSYSFEELVFLGTLGGRADHSMANMQSMLFAAKKGIPCTAATEKLEIKCSGPTKLSLNKDHWRWVSVFAAEHHVKGLSLRGLKYPLTNATLAADTPLGLSNEFVQNRASISWDEGCLYIVRTCHES